MSSAVLTTGDSKMKKQSSFSTIKNTGMKRKVMDKENRILKVEAAVEHGLSERMLFGTKTSLPCALTSRVPAKILLLGSKNCAASDRVCLVAWNLVLDSGLA